MTLFAKSLIQREQKRSDDLTAENKELNKAMRDQTVPAITAATSALANATLLFQAIKNQWDLETAMRERDKRDEQR